MVASVCAVAGRVAEARAVAGGGDAATQRRHHRHHRRHHHHLPRAKRAHKLFVFGDDFADNGNSASDPGLGSVSRAWRYPFGMSDAAHGRKEGHRPLLRRPGAVRLPGQDHGARRVPSALRG
jgi:hypothetical protein